MGSLLGLLVAPPLIENFGWESVFYIFGVLGAYHASDFGSLAWSDRSLAAGNRPRPQCISGCTAGLRYHTACSIFSLLRLSLASLCFADRNCIACCCVCMPNYALVRFSPVACSRRCAAGTPAPSTLSNQNCNSLKMSTCQIACALAVVVRLNSHTLSLHD